MNKQDYAGQRLSDLAGHLWIGSRVWVTQSNLEFKARVLAGSKKRAYVKAESINSTPKWHPSELCEVIEVKQ